MKVMKTSNEHIATISPDQMSRAIAHGDLRKVAAITEKYGLSHCKDWLKGYALLEQALSCDQPDIAEFLIKAGAKQCVNRKGEVHSILHDAVATSPRFGPMVKLLLSAGASVNARNGNGDSPLHFVKHVGIAKLLFADANSPADVHAVNSAGLTPLHAAAKAGNVRIVEFLLTKGADVNSRVSANDNLNTPLHEAAQCPAGQQAARAAKTLLLAGADINARNSRGETALHLAVLHHIHSSYLTEALLSWPQVDVDARDDKGNTALALAADRVYFIPFAALLEGGADVNVPNNDGLTPVQTVERMRERSSGAYTKASSLRCRLLRMSVALRSHVAKLKCADLPVSEANLLACQLPRYRHEDLAKIPIWHTWETLDDPDFVKRCTDEVEKMKKDRIGDSCITYYDVLSGSRRQVANYTKNATVSQAMVSGDYARKEFPVYGGLVAVRFRRAKVAAKLQDAALASLSAIFALLPGLCIDRIIDFLSNEDLQKCSDSLSDPVLKNLK